MPVFEQPFRLQDANSVNVLFKAFPGRFLQNVLKAGGTQTNFPGDACERELASGYFPH
jgi:hypothetical protein